MGLTDLRNDGSWRVEMKAMQKATEGHGRNRGEMWRNKIRAAGEVMTLPVGATTRH